MRYGMVFVLEVRDFESGEEFSIVSMPGDYVRTAGWADEHLADVAGGDVVRSIERNYALLWHALERLGRTAELGLAAELDAGCIGAMMDRFSVFVEDFEEKDIPLTEGRAR